MNRMKSTLAFALAAALGAPSAFAQSGNTTQAHQAEQATQTDAVVREQLLTTNAPVPSELDETRPPPVSEGMEEEEEEAMRRDPRPTARTPAQTRAADESAPARRDLWSRLDANGDGRISVTEGDANADFKSNFEMMDADRDGYVSDSEYRPRGDDRNDDRDDRPGDDDRDDSDHDRSDHDRDDDRRDDDRGDG